MFSQNYLYRNKIFLIMILFLILFLSIYYSFINLTPAAAQSEDINNAAVADSAVGQAAMPAGVSLDQDGIAQLNLVNFFRKLIFSFLASTTSLSGLFWVVIRGGWPI
jgi:hypothetical protein